MKIYKRIFNESFSIIAYHGSPYDFDNFDMGKAGSLNDPGDYGIGIYFDTNKMWARAYIGPSIKSKGVLYICEISLKKYYEIDFVLYDKYEGEIKRWKREINPELQKYIDTLVAGGLPIKEISGRENNPGETINNFLSISRRYGSKNITKALEKQGYKGVVVHYGSSDEIVVYDINSIKIIDKENI
jgi:hypothetical protein